MRAGPRIGLAQSQNELFCRGFDEEEGGEVERRKLLGLGVSDVRRMFGRWLKRHWLRWWWPESVVGGRRKGCREERKAERRRERVVAAA
jgi:hypothetical protein